PKRSTDASSTSAAPPSGSATSPTTSPDPYSRPAASDPYYTVNCEEPLNHWVGSVDVNDMLSHAAHCRCALCRGHYDVLATPEARDVRACDFVTTTSGASVQRAAERRQPPPSVSYRWALSIFARVAAGPVRWAFLML